MVQQPIFRFYPGIRVRFRALLLVVLTALSPLDTYPADNQAIELLRAMQSAAGAQSFAGNFVYLHNTRLEAMRIIHLVKNGVERERIYSLNGSNREVIKDEHAVWCYLPDEKTGVHEYRQAGDRQFPGILPDDIRVLEQYYRYELGGQDRIADRMAQEVMIIPLDEYRYGYSLWADDTTRLPLRADLKNIAGEIIEQYVFISLETGADLDENDLTPSTPAGDLNWLGMNDDESKRVIPQPDIDWKVTRLPPGFHLTRHLYRMSPMRNYPKEHFVFSDGLAAVSVFISVLDEKADNSDPMSGLSTMGAINAYARSVADHQVTVIGEVPETTVILIADAVTD